MAVVLILGILIGIAVASYALATDRARIITCQANQRGLNTAVMAYAQDHEDALPANMDALKPYVATKDYDKCPSGPALVLRPGDRPCHVSDPSAPVSVQAGATRRDSEVLALRMARADRGRCRHPRHRRPVSAGAPGHRGGRRTTPAARRACTVRSIGAATAASSRPSWRIVAYIALRAPLIVAQGLSQRPARPCRPPHGHLRLRRHRRRRGVRPHQVRPRQARGRREHRRGYARVQRAVRRPAARDEPGAARALPAPFSIVPHDARAGAHLGPAAVAAHSR